MGGLESLLEKLRGDAKDIEEGYRLLNMWRSLRQSILEQALKEGKAEELREVLDLMELVEYALLFSIGLRILPHLVTVYTVLHRQELCELMREQPESVPEEMRKLIEFLGC